MLDLSYKVNHFGMNDSSKKAETKREMKKFLLTKIPYERNKKHTFVMWLNKNK